MKHLLLLCGAIFFLLLTGCSTGIKRTGYKLPEHVQTKNLPQCKIAIQCYPMFRKDDVTVVGRISSFDKGFSVNCDEAAVLEIFCKEACSLGADIVVIKEEKHPDDWSTCYRAKAEFVRFNDRAKAQRVVSDSRFAPDLIISRSEVTKQRNKEMIRQAVMAGILGGLSGAAMSAAVH